MTEDALSGIEDALPADRLLRDRHTREEYRRDSWPRALWWTAEEARTHTPAAVALPRSAQETAALLRWCHKRSVPVVPRGGGSGVLGAAVPATEGAIVLDLTRLDDKPLTADGEPELISAGAGIYGDALERSLNARGLSCAHFPASMAVSTLGGWVATDGWGQCSTAHGPFRDRVTAVDCVLPDGQILRSADPAAWIGSEGSLGVMTRVTFRAMRDEREHAYAAYEFPDMAAGLRALRAVTEAGLRPAVARLYDGLDRRFLGPEKEQVSDAGGEGDRIKSRLLLLRGSLRRLADLPGVRGMLKPLLVLITEGAAARSQLARAADIVKHYDAANLGEKPARSWWRHRYRLNFEKVENYRKLGCFADTLDVVAPWAKIETVYSDMIRAASAHGLAMAHASHLHQGGACLYFTLSGAGMSDTGTLRHYAGCWRAMIEACIDAGGRPDHHHGIGLAKKPWLNDIKSSEWIEDWRERKARLDPQGIMNPGKWG
ncbi:MAG: FAD-binding oxidoreductase [Elusimicrobiota bacterium]